MKRFMFGRIQMNPARRLLVIYIVEQQQFHRRAAFGMHTEIHPIGR
jgi:hypothetical protein